MRGIFEMVLLFILLMTFHTSVYAQKGKLLLFSKQLDNMVYGGYLPQNYAPNGFITRIHTNHIQDYYMYYPGAKLRTSKGKQQVDFSHRKYQVSSSYHIINTNIQADEYIKLGNKCPKNIYAYRNRQPGQAVVADYSCPKVFIGDFSFVNYMNKNTIYVDTRTGRLVTKIRITSYAKKTKKYPRKILSPAPSDENMIAIVSQWHNAILHYAKDNGWEIGTYKPNLDKDKNLDSDILEKPITIPKTNLSVNISANKEIQEEPNHCKKPIDDAWKEYCANKAYNAQLDAKEAIEDKKIEEKLKADEEHQAMLDKWYEEDRQANIKHRESLSDQNRKLDEAEQKENQAFHDDIVKMQQEQKAKLENMKQAQEQTRTSLKIIDRFGGDIDTQLMAYEKVIALSNNADLDKATKIKEATKKQYFDFSQMRHQGEAEYQTAKANEIDKKAKYVKSIKDTSLTANRILAEVDKTGFGKKILDIQKDIYTYIEGGVEAFAISKIKGKVDEKTFKLGGGLVDRKLKQHKFYTTGLKVTPKDRLYDENGYLLRKVKKGDRIFNKEKQDITFSFERRLNQFSTRDLATHKARKDILSGDPNKIIGGIMDSFDISKKIANKFWRK